MSIIKYYNGNNTFENIRYLTKCDNNGVSALNLTTAAKKLGFSVRALKLDLKDLRNIRLPCIVHLTLENGYMHYIIINKINEKGIYVFDPALGNKKYIESDFIKIWNNIAIELIPNRKLDNTIDKNKFIFLSILKDNKKIYIEIMLLSFISIVLTILINCYFKSLIDTSDLLIILIIFSIVVLIKELVDYIKNRLIIKLETNIDKEITLKTHNKLLSLPYYYFNSRSTGDILSKIYDLDYVKELFIKIPIFFFIDIVLFILLTIIFMYINTGLFLIFLCICLVYFSVLVLFNRKTKNLIALNQESNAISNKVLVENISSINTIKNLDINSYRCNAFENEYNKYLYNKVLYQKAYSLENYIKNIIIFVGINIILYIGMRNINKGLLNLSDLVFFNSLMLYYVEVFKSICDLNPLLKNSINALKRINEIYLIKSNRCEETDLNSFDVKISNLDFSYDGYHNVIKNLNLVIPGNQKLVVVGESGSGKSTLFKLINKTYEVDTNKIFVGGFDINKMNTNAFISYVSQEENLFNDTLYNNLVLDKKYESNIINEIMKLTGLNKIIERRKLNLNSIIEENGINFSKGERQKIILTRVLLKDNKILILDEALNGIEENEEYDILNNIIKKYRNRTIVYITHRKKCVTLFDKILDFNKIKEEK